LTARSDSTRQLTRSLADLNLAKAGELHLSRLPFSRREAAAILASTPRGLGKQALDFEASRKFATSGELTDYRVVHFATHALVDEAHPEFSALVLSLVDEHGKSQDGFVKLQDIYNLHLAADLVVLSACDTALGKQVEGEGVIGLTRGFMYAGASTVISSLWKVDDFATAELMTDFYKFTERGMRPAAALRAAQLDLRKQKRWRDPYYWAGFTLHGEWK
jgi:CHAT domain-containing protein